MGVKNVVLGTPGTALAPRIVYIFTDDTVATIQTVGYLDKLKSQGFVLLESDMALVTTKLTPLAKEIQVGWYDVSITDNIITLTLPTNTEAIKSITGTPNQIDATAGPDVVLSLPALIITPGNLVVTGILTANSANVTTTLSVGTTLNVGTSITTGNLLISGNTVASTDVDGNISLLPAGVGEVLLKADPVAPLAAATKAYVDTLGDVQGPAVATDNALALFDGTTGKLIKNSSVTLVVNDMFGLDVLAVGDMVLSGNAIDNPGGDIFLNTIAGGTVHATKNFDGYHVIPTQVSVRVLSDFPTPAAGVITLAGDTQYFIQGNVNIGANVLDFANFGTSISGVQSRATFLTGATATAMITTSGGDSVELRDITITQTGAGALMDVILINFNRFDIINCRLGGGSLIGRSGSTLQLNSTFMFGGCGFLSAAPGITFVVFSQCAIVDSDPGDVLLDFPAAAPTADFQFINGALTTTNGGTAIRTFDPGLIGLGTISDSAYTGVGTLFDGISQASDTWLMTNNTGIPESNDQGSVTVSAAGTVVAIAAVNTFTDVTDAGVGINWAIVAGAEKFTLTNPNTGELTYNGVRDLAFGFGGFLTMSRVGGTDLTIRMAIVVNDVPLLSSISAIELDTNTVFTIYVPWFKVIMNNGDRVRLQIENTTNDTDITLFDASMSAGR